MARTNPRKPKAGGASTGSAVKRKPKKAVQDPKPAKKPLDVVDEAGRESFPASDAPSWTP